MNRQERLRLKFDEAVRNELARLRAERSNPNCDGPCLGPHDGEVRRLPMGAGVYLRLCQPCFLRAIRYRKRQNRDLPIDAHFDMPLWTDLSVHTKEGGAT